MPNDDLKHYNNHKKKDYLTHHTDGFDTVNH